jgi:peptidoglycan/xylan/chitin deacetylase (PgdA/CDA1 family)
MFIQGRWAQAYPRTARSIAAAGHLVGCHSHFHARMPMLSRRGLDSDVRRATRALRDITGVDPRPWFRCPFGAIDAGTAVLDQLGRLGYRNVGWHVDSRDWATRGTRAGEAIARSVVEGVVAQRDGAIVLMHGWPAPSAAALPLIVARLKDHGADFVTVDQLDQIPTRAAWDHGPG